jgi:hypothetical protein
MKTTDIFKTSAKKLNEGLSKTFGKKIDFASFDIPKLEDARNKLRTQVHQIRGQSGFNENMESDAYLEAQWMLDAINAEIAEREELLSQGGTAEVEEETDEGILDNMWKASKQAVRHGIDPDADWDKIDSDHEMVTSLQDAGYSDKEIKMAYGILNDPRYKQGNLTGALAKIEKIAPGMADEPAFQKVMKATQESIEQGDTMEHVTEGEVQQASAIVTAKTMVDRVGRWIEELSGMENDTLLQLGDSIRDEIGDAQSKSFIEASAPSIQQALETLKGTRDALSQAVNTLATGEAPADMLGAEPEAGADMEAPAPEAGADMSAEAPAEDEFAAAEPATGGVEAAGREQRESIQRQNDLMKILAG